MENQEEIEVRQDGKVKPAAEGKARKKKLNVEKWKKTVDQKKRYSSKYLPTLPTCQHMNEKFKCTTLTMQDIRKFHACIYETKSKLDQDNKVILYSSCQSPKRYRARGERQRVKDLSSNFYVPISQQGVKSKVQVCRKAFSQISGINEKRIQRVCKRHFSTGSLATDNRGGDTRSQSMIQQRGAVKEFIENLVPLESHYCRSRQAWRVYLPSHLNIASLWEQYNSTKEKHLNVKYQFFICIFISDYNIGFGSPATDQCSKCLQFKERLKSGEDCKVEYDVHKNRANYFYVLLKKNNESEITFTFDCQKNLVLPKLTDQATYYSRQFYLYNFTVCEGTSKEKLSKEKVSIFTWTEADNKKGSTQIASAVYHKLCNTNMEDYEFVRLFADGAGGQNKNSILIFMLMYWLSNRAPENIKGIKLFFPVAGHSYLPPDRVFGLIERDLKKIETIIQPKEYYNVFQKHGTVLKIDTDFHVFDWKTPSQTVMKLPANWHFRFAPSKRFMITRGQTPTASVLVQGEAAYMFDTGTAKKVFKPTMDVNSAPVDKVIVGIPVNPAKKKDVRHLLQLHFGDRWEEKPELGFYKRIVNDEQVPEEESENEEDGGHMEEIDNIV